MGLLPIPRSVPWLGLPEHNVQSPFVSRGAPCGAYLSFLRWKAQSLPCLSVPKPPSPGTWGGARGQRGRWLLSGSGLSVGIRLAAGHSGETRCEQEGRCQLILLLPSSAAHGEGWAKGGVLWHIWGPTCSNILCWGEEGCKCRQHTCAGAASGTPAAAFQNVTAHGHPPPQPLRSHLALATSAPEVLPGSHMEILQRSPYGYSLLFPTLLLGKQPSLIKLRDSFLKFKQYNQNTYIFKSKHSIKAPATSDYHTDNF